MYHSNRLGFFMIGCGMAEGLMVLIVLGFGLVDHGCHRGSVCVEGVIIKWR